MSRRAEDLKLLDDLLDKHADELSEREAEAFAGMRLALQTQYHQLTEPQRAWVVRAHGRVVTEEAQNLVSRGLVPRGREVALAPVLLNLPKSPPPMPKPVKGAPVRGSRRHCGKEDDGCYAFVNGDCACACCR